MTARRLWTEAEDATMRAFYADVPTRVLAKRLNRSERAVYDRATILGLCKSPAYLASSLAGRLDGVRGGRTRFKPGNVPANKGVRRPGWAPGRMAEHQFKPGRPAHEARNYMPIGSERINKGILERKVTDDPALVPARRWVPVARLVWEAAHGPVPAGHVVAFLPGQRTTERDLITLDRLELVSRATLMQRNTLHNLPKPLADVVRLRGALNRVINRRSQRP